MSLFTRKEVGFSTCLRNKAIYDPEQKFREVRTQIIASVCFAACFVAGARSWNSTLETAVLGISAAEESVWCELENWMPILPKINMCRLAPSLPPATSALSVCFFQLERRDGGG